VCSCRESAVTPVLPDLTELRDPLDPVDPPEPLEPMVARYKIFPKKCFFICFSEYNDPVESEHVGAKLMCTGTVFIQSCVFYAKQEQWFVMCVSRESPVPLELQVDLDTRDKVACLESVEVLVALESRERR